MNNKNFAWPVTTLCKYDYSALLACLNKYEVNFKNKKIILMGAGIRGTMFSLLLKDFGYHDIAFCDNNPEKVGGAINEFDILSFDEVQRMKNKVVVIITVENGYSLIDQFVSAGFVLNDDLFYIESELYKKYLSEFTRQNCEILVMGDCGVTDISMKDTDFTNLGEMIQQEIGMDKVKILAVHAMGMRAFYHVLSAHIAHMGVPKKIAIMANFETFTGKQHLLPRSQHCELIKQLCATLGGIDEQLNEYAQLTTERFSNFKLDYFTSSKQFQTSDSSHNDKLVFHLNYMYKLKEDNECIVYLQKVCELCKNNSIKLLFFIPPVNYMYATSLLGEIFREKYDANVNHLKHIIASELVPVLDLSYLLTDDCFASKHTIDETANYVGRVKQAEKICQALRRL